METTLRFQVNGKAQTVSSEPDRPLLEVVREDLQLTGSKYGCGEGQCGACSMLIDGKRVFACKTSVSRADGKSVQTIEGLASGDKLHPIQEAFLAESAFQCGYCTAGMIMATHALLTEKPRPSEDEIRGWMTKNICRCGSYVSILRAVRRAAGLEAK